MWVDARSWEDGKVVKVGIVAIGRELLTGRVQDTNSAWIAKRVTCLGGKVVRIAVVDDDPEAIAQEVRHLIREGASVTITTGGLGPTADDQTLEGIALALDRPLVLNPQAFRMVEERYRVFADQGFVQDAEIDESRRKMAVLLEGSRPLENPVGVAPGVLLEVEGFVVSLPGVPAEMEAIFEGSVLGFLKTLTQGTVYKERTVATGTGDESRLAPILQKVMRKAPRVYLKSRATHFGQEVSLEVILSAAALEGEVEALLDEAEEELKIRLRVFSG